jgi:hypothetical protein
MPPFGTFLRVIARYRPSALLDRNDNGALRNCLLECMDRPGGLDDGNGMVECLLLVCFVTLRDNSDQ